MKCKNCKKTIILAFFGLRDFCSDECKKDHQKVLNAKRQRRFRECNAESQKDNSNIELSKNNAILTLPEASLQVEKMGFEPFKVKLFYNGRSVIVKINFTQDSEYVFVEYADIIEQRAKTVVEQWLKDGFINRYEIKTEKDMDSSNVTKSEPYLKPVCEGQNRGLRPYEDYESFGGKKWFALVKKDCCNFEVRQRELYCVALEEPYEPFKAKCCDCELGRGLKTYRDNAVKNKSKINTIIEQAQSQGY